MFKEALDNWLIPIQTHAKVIHPKYYKLKSNESCTFLSLGRLDRQGSMYLLSHSTALTNRTHVTYTGPPKRIGM